MKSNLCHLSMQKPPEFLFCAVKVEKSYEVFRSGLKRLKDPFVEVYASEAEARQAIKGNHPSLFTVLSGVMNEEGYDFYHAETGEWLADEIPARYLRLC